jgi:uncharacterized protein (TIGR02001 family)
MRSRQPRAADRFLAHRRALAIVFAASSLSLASPAWAQVGAGLSADSDFRFRGDTLTDGRPSLTLNISYDHESGAYAGGSLVGAQGVHGGGQFVGYFAYIGYATRAGKGVSWDVGVSNAGLTQIIPGQASVRKYMFNYTEVYVGAITDNLSAHIHYSPDYFGEHVSTVYVDVDGAIRPVLHWRLFGHVGALTPVSGGEGPQGGRRERYDLRAGVAREFKRCEVRLAWTTASPDPEYPPEYAPRRQAFVVGASYFF